MQTEIAETTKVNVNKILNVIAKWNASYISDIATLLILHISYELVLTNVSLIFESWNKSCTV